MSDTQTTPEQLARLDEASSHPYECKCDLCKEWWDSMPPEEDGSEEECMHEDAEIDWQGRLFCTCGHSEYLGSVRLAQIDRMRAEADERYHEEMAEAVKQEIDKTLPETLPAQALDDELPF